MMELNKDDKRRAKILEGYLDPRAFGGTQYFENVPLEVLGQLIIENFADPQERQNHSPTIKQFFDFMLKYPESRVSGYIVVPERDDYRVSVDGITIKGEATVKMIVDFVEFAQGADGLVIKENKLDAWWD